MKFKAAILTLLIFFGIVLSLYVYWGIVSHNFLKAGMFFVAFLVTAMYAAKIMVGFRELNKSISARNKIQEILSPITGDKKHSFVLAENLVLRKTDIKNWPEIPQQERERIGAILKHRS